MIRLSVIVPALRGPELAERAIRSVFNQADPIGTEVIAVLPHREDSIQAHLVDVLKRQASLELLRFVSVDSHDPVQCLNQGTVAARGNFLAFLDSRDQWLYGRLIELWPILEAADLILSPSPEHASSTDWLAEYRKSRRGSLSAAVIRRSLFEAAGGFTPSLDPDKDYDGHPLWLHSLSLLEQARRMGRFIPLPGHNIRFELTPPGWSSPGPSAS